jgi:hypothetical protein
MVPRLGRDAVEKSEPVLVCSVAWKMGDSGRLQLRDESPWIRGFFIPANSLGKERHE